MLDVQKSHADVTRIPPCHEVPELLRAAYVENLLVPIDIIQERHEESEPLAAHTCRRRIGRAVVGERLDDGAPGSSCGRARCVCHSIRTWVVRRRNRGRSSLSGLAKKLTWQQFRRGVCPTFSRGDLCRESPGGDIPLTRPLTGTDHTC